MLKKITSIILLLFLISTFAFANETEQNTAQFISAQITNINGTQQSLLQDDNTSTGVNYYEGDVLEIIATSDVHGIYMVWDIYPENGYVITQDEIQYTQNSGFFQECLDVDLNANTAFKIQFSSFAKLVEVKLLTDGTLPQSVHNWQLPPEQADILLMPTHSDDEHLFFGGVMPTYTNMGDVNIVVAYMVNHSTEPYRQQEMLNGLWEAGLRNYPIVPHFADMYSDSLAHAKTIYNEQEIIDYIVNLYERFSPQVVVGHDLNGEYGHGAHMLYANSMLLAAEQAQQKPQKIYLHLYGENEIVMDVDTPLENFGGKSAFEVAQDAFAHHKSQQIYFSVEKSGLYDLRKFGLAFSLTPPDTTNDMLENITTYAQMAQIKQQEEQEAAQKAEELAAALQEKEAKENAAAQSAASELLIRQHENYMQLIYILLACLVVVVAVLMVFVVLIIRRKGKK